MVKVESNQPELFGPSMDPYGRAAEPTYLSTEIESMRSNPVLELALVLDDALITKYPLVKNSHDAKNDLRRKLGIGVIPNTHWIRVSVESTAPDEARDIVNAVINAYQEKVVSETLDLDSTTPTGRKLTAKKQLQKKIAEAFKIYKDGLDKKIKEAKDALRDLARRDDALATKAEQESKGERGPVKFLGVKTWNSHLNEIEASFVRDDLERYYPMFDQVNRKLEALEFTKGKTGIEIEKIYEAELPRVPNSNDQVKYMALLPVVVLISLLGLFLVFGHDRPRR